MNVTKEQVARALSVYLDNNGDRQSSFQIALQDFVDRNHLVSLPPADLQLGAVMELGKFEPVRDYRKELWIAVWQQCLTDPLYQDVPAACHHAVEEFDKFFGGAQ